jgi:small-conductance mechanosensitive channel
MQPPVTAPAVIAPAVTAADPSPAIAGPGLMLVGLAALGVVVMTLLLRRVAHAPALQRWARWSNPVIVLAWASLAALVTWRVLSVADTWNATLARGLAVVATLVIVAPLARDLLAAAVIGIEGRYRTGDDVRVGVHEGRIAALGLRSVVLRADDGSEIAVRNQQFLASDVVRLNSASGQASVEFDLTVARGEDLDALGHRLVDAALISPLAAPGSLPEVFVTETDADRVRVRVRAYVFDREYAARYKSDILARLAPTDRGSSTDTARSLAPRSDK